MIRIAWFALLVAIGASILTEGNRTVIQIAFGTIAFFAWALISGRTSLKCPYCFKRVKLGATVCHHCGREVSQVVGITPAARVVHCVAVVRAAT